jgi:hypothetical protein
MRYYREDVGGGGGAGRMSAWHILHNNNRFPPATETQIVREA